MSRRSCAHFPDRQLSGAGSDHRQNVLRPFAVGTILSVDQRTFAHQGFLRNLQDRREESSLGGGLRLCASRHPQRASRIRVESVQDSPTSQLHSIRKDLAFTGLVNFNDQSPKVELNIQLHMFNLKFDTTDLLQ